MTQGKQFGPADTVERASGATTWKPVWAKLTVYNKICPVCTKRYQLGERSSWVDIEPCTGCLAEARAAAELDRQRKMLAHCRKRAKDSPKAAARIPGLAAVVAELEKGYRTKYARRRAAG